MLTLDQVRSKSNKRLIGLQPVVLAATLALIERCYKRGVPIVITQGLRTIAEQDALYAQGRTKPGSIVTNAKGGTSYHNYGLAVDFALLMPDGSSVSWDLKRDGDCDKAADWEEVVQEAKALGFEWGGDFTSIKDAPHFQMSFGLKISHLKEGKRPGQMAVNAVFARIGKFHEEVEETMTAVEKKEFEDMKLIIKAQAEVTLTLSNRITELENKNELVEIPSWAFKACEAAKAAGVLKTAEDGSHDFYRMVTILDRLGLFTKGVK